MIARHRQTACAGPVRRDGQRLADASENVFAFTHLASHQPTCGSWESKIQSWKKMVGRPPTLALSSGQGKAVGPGPAFLWLSSPLRLTPCVDTVEDSPCPSGPSGRGPGWGRTVR